MFPLLYYPETLIDNMLEQIDVHLLDIFILYL